MTERDWHRTNAAEEAGLLCSLNLQAILDHHGVASVEALARALHKHTPCGPWLSVRRHDGAWAHAGDLAGVATGDVRSLRVGSIVEGSDTEVQGAEIDLLTDAAFQELIDALATELERVDARVQQHLRELVDNETGAFAIDAPHDEPPRERLFEVELHATVIEAESYRVRAGSPASAIRAALAQEVDPQERAFLEVRERRFWRVRELAPSEDDPEAPTPEEDA